LNYSNVANLGLRPRDWYSLLTYLEAQRKVRVQPGELRADGPSVLAAGRGEDPGPKLLEAFC